MQRVLIIKTGYCETFRPDLTYAAVSFGDVLRTTPILHLFRDQEVHWLTDIKAVPLLYGLKEISKIHLVNTLDVLGLETYQWDRIVNLESSRGACQLAKKLMQPHSKFVGYYYDREEIHISSPYSGNSWSEKLFSLFGEKWNDQPLLLPHRLIKKEKGLIFLNKGVGPKLPEKRWDRWASLRDKIEAIGLETESQKSIAIEDFVDEISRSEFMISTDSLGLHIAIALGIPVLGLFGPSLADEVSGLKHYLQVTSLETLSSEDVFTLFEKLYEA
jgi:heptosyltransferase-2